MSENQSEQQLADQARIQLLEAIKRAAEVGNGETARQLAEAYSIVNASAPTETKGTTVVRPPLAGRR
ncbi:hypothetical protein ACWDBT_27555 [Streptomyces ardesiacus]